LKANSRDKAGNLIEAPPNKSLDASGGSLFRNELDAAQGPLIRAAASTQPLCSFLNHCQKS